MILQSDQLKVIADNNIDNHTNTENIQDKIPATSLIPAGAKKNFPFGLRIIENYLRNAMHKEATND